MLPRNILRSLFVAAFLTASCILPAAEPISPEVTVYRADGDYVVFLHGFSIFNNSLSTLAKRVNAAGFESIDIKYPSQKVTPESVIADYLRPTVKNFCTDPKRKIHFVGYSMGTVFIHRFLEETPPSNLGRVVFLAGPHRGTHLIDILKEKLSFLVKPFGPAANRLGTDEHAFPQSLGVPNFSPGVIMGRRSTFPFFSPLIPGPDDGIVPVEGGKIPGAADFIVIDSSHTDMQRSRAASILVIDFLTTGRFDHQKKYRPDHPRPRITTMKRRHF